MSDAVVTHRPSAAGTAQPNARRALRDRLTELEPGLEVLAEGVLGESSEIDLLARDARGAVVVVLMGASGEDLALLARGLAQAEWARRRVRDWLQLAPEIGLSTEAEARALLLCPGFQPETLLAAASLPPGRVELVQTRFESQADRLGPRLERIPVALGGPRRPGGADIAEPAPFRSGLRDEDLLLTADERRELL